MGFVILHIKVPDWEWSYKYDYAPNLTSIIEAMSFKLGGREKRGASKKENNQYKLFPVNNSTEVATSSSSPRTLAAFPGVETTEPQENSGFQKSFSRFFKILYRIQSYTLIGETNNKNFRCYTTIYQLLFILPPDSSNLLPYPLCEAFTNELKIYAPKN